MAERPAREDDRRVVEAVEQAYERLERADTGIFIELVDRRRATEAAARVDAALDDGARLPLAGRTLAVKGNIDVRGHRTTAGCPSYGTIAADSARAVRALEAAGAVVVAITNLDQFATGLVGTRSPHGPCPNAWWPNLISGGSSSGSAVAVARGLVDIALGTDTAGSGRVPAAANGIVGVKPTKGRISTAGVVAACASIDCVSTFARDLDLAVLAADLAAGFDHSDTWSRAAPPAAPPRGGPLRVGVPTAGSLTFCGDAYGAATFTAVLAPLLASAHVEAIDVDLNPFLAAGRLLYDGAFVAERYAAVGAFVDANPDALDPIVGSIISAAGRLPAWKLTRDIEQLRRLRAVTAPTWRAIDVLVVPSVPRIPTVAEVAAEPVLRNSELGTYTNFVNLLDLCAITIPSGIPTVAGPPASITLIAPAWGDAGLAVVARQLMGGDRLLS